MIIERIVGNTEKTELGSKRIEIVYMRSDDLVKRVQRVETDRGTQLGIRLSEPKDLCDGDILFADEGRAVVLRVLPDLLIVIRPRSTGQMGFIAHQIGNRHVPAQFEGDTMLVQYDRLLTELLEQHEVPFIVEERAVRQAFRHIGHSHDHAPGHSVRFSPDDGYARGHEHPHSHSHSHEHSPDRSHAHSHGS
ncbi:urease accessory protein UreE [Cohnella zeiphila]|uniref:Urease accessory protein UreE n=1 Tax=Cohnella zeiphila TaxID=2761120 RepID=A0A7X0SHD6_9BACL|nr:urease accessory protein UreE [Cohnella zeiphila]MBB6729881.1 urease accessory protein UreE [Cohnella zeiphila]